MHKLSDIALSISLWWKCAKSSLGPGLIAHERDNSSRPVGLQRKFKTSLGNFLAPFLNFKPWNLLFSSFWNLQWPRTLLLMFKMQEPPPELLGCPPHLEVLPRDLAWISPTASHLPWTSQPGSLPYRMSRPQSCLSPPVTLPQKPPPTQCPGHLTDQAVPLLSGPLLITVPPASKKLSIKVIQPAASILIFQDSNRNLSHLLGWMSYSLQQAIEINTRMPLQCLLCLVCCLCVGNQVY